ncbi:MAG: hypothetical protein HC869_19530 [Rhodospirillales bacterium]|nr:hypothetical protein [Rhodospirillales bacterium]
MKVAGARRRAQQAIAPSGQAARTAFLTNLLRLYMGTKGEYRTNIERFCGEHGMARRALQTGGLENEALRDGMGLGLLVLIIGAAQWWGALLGA